MHKHRFSSYIFSHAFTNNPHIPITTMPRENKASSQMTSFIDYSSMLFRSALAHLRENLGPQERDHEIH
ncbi:MAG TPA: hypothetical protein VF903_00435, partial [Nitrospirota bacterium]